MSGTGEQFRMRRAGFTLLEVSAALFILTVGISGIVVSFHQGFGKIRSIQESHVAIRAIENEIEFLRAIPFDSIQSGPFQSTIPETLTLVRPEFVVEVDVHEELPDQLKHITVSVDWTGENARRIRKSVSTLLARTR